MEGGGFNIGKAVDKAKEAIRKGVVLTAAAATLTAATLAPNTSFGQNKKAETTQAASREIKAGPYTFDVKQVVMHDGWGNKTIGDELFYKGQKLELNFGISGSDGTDFHVVSIDRAYDGTIVVTYTAEGKTFIAQAVFKANGDKLEKISDKEAPMLGPKTKVIHFDQ